MLKTRGRKILADIRARKGRTVLAILSILIGVFGVTTLVSTTDLLSRQLREDIQASAISHTHIYVMASQGKISLAENQTYLQALASLDGVVDVEGQAVYSVAWQKATAEADEVEDGFMVAFTEPFAEVDLERVARLTAGRFPSEGAHEIAVEQRFADKYDIKVGDELRFPALEASASVQTPVVWRVVGLVIHPYFTIAPALQDQIQPSQALYAHYADAQAITGFNGLSAIHVRYQDTASSQAGLDELLQTISQQTPYITLFTFLDDPDSNFIMEIIDQVNLSLNALGVVAMVISGFLVTNVMNAIVIEQKRQIGVMKSLGASLPDTFFIYAGIALVYGVTGAVLGIALAIPLAAFLAQNIAETAFTYIDGFQISLLGIGVGAVLGIIVPVLAAFVPVANGMRVSILAALTDLGLTSSWGQSRVSRAIGGLPLPPAISQALKNIYQKKGRLFLTVLTLMMAVAAFMSVTMITRSLNDVVESVYTTTAYEISITPQNPQSLETMQALLETQTREIAYIAPGYNMTVGVEGFESTNPFSAGTNQVSVTGIDPTQPSIAFELMEGTGWQGDSAQAGVVVSRVLASALDKNVGDEITLTVGAQTRTYPIIGVHNYPFDAVYMHWQDLATLGNYVDDEGNPLASVFYVGLTGEHSLGEIDDQIEILSSGLLATGIQASYTNQREVEATQAQQITLFGMVFSMSAGVMAAVGAIGLMATLSMAVYERQKEIGVVRSIGASSRSIITQFMLEGMMVGFLAWVVAVPLSLVMGLGLVQILPFDYLNFTVMPQYLLLGLLGVLLVAGLSSLGPSWLAARKTVSEILRYQ